MNSETWQIKVLKDLNASKLSSEEHSVEIITKLDTLMDEASKSDVNCEAIKDIATDIISRMQYHDLNRQKIERAMNLLIDNENISEDMLSKFNISACVSAKHIDSSDGEAVSDEELAALIANANN